MNSEVNDVPERNDEEKKKKKKKKKMRCAIFECKKKVGFDPIVCTGCNTSYCERHRLKHEHSCDSDKIKQTHREFIVEKNPVVVADKMQYRI
jgi:predicted nucleic acid binding AN1-type Zn finger protein